MNRLILLIYIGILIYASIVDYRTFIVKNHVHVVIMLLTLSKLKESNLFFMLLQGLMLTIPFLYLAIKTNQLGGGDIKFIFANALILGGIKSYYGIIIGLVICIGVWGVKKALRIKGKTNKIPLIPYLSIGYIIILFIYDWAIIT